MIKKLQAIKNIGTFEDYTASGDVSLKEFNLIYAENGSGKTTLARILHSLSTGNGAIIKSHRRIATTDGPMVSIVDENSRQYNYSGDRWNKIMQDIEVFDTHFVNDNVYSGFEISGDNRRNLYKFVLGESGVQIAKKIERIKALITAKNNELAEGKNIILQTAHLQDVDKIMEIKPKDDVDELITAKKEELRIAQNNIVISQQPSLPLLPPFSFPLDKEETERFLSISVDGIGNEFLELVNNHLEELNSAGMENGRQWILSGYKAVRKSEKDICPFCGKPLGVTPLIEGYNQYFNQNYLSAIQDIKTLREKLSSFTIDLYINQVTATYERIEELYLFWKNYITSDSLLPPFDYNFDNLRDRLSSLKSIVEIKNSNPMEAMSLTNVESLYKEIQIVADKIATVNVFITTYNEGITNSKNKLRNVNDVVKELRELELTKERFEEPLAGYCSMYNIILYQCERLGKINRQYQAEQKALSQNIIANYGQKINLYLQETFRTDFKISEIKDGGFKGKSREADIEYTLTFKDTPIDYSGDNNTSFKNVLSEGDKNTIAFCFFLAKITTDSDIHNKIIVFDDPLSSLDFNRKFNTIELLLGLHGQCKQLIILSHNLNFLTEFCSRVNPRDHLKTLQIINTSGRSSIENYEIKKEWISRYQKSLDTMHAFLEHPSESMKGEAIGAIRISLETFLKLKYCRYLSSQNLPFGAVISELENSKCGFINHDKKKVIGDLRLLNNIAWRTHHGSTDDRNVNISLSETQKSVCRTCELIYREL